MNSSVQIPDVSVKHEPLTKFAAEVLTRAGLHSNDASYTADTLVQTSLRGVDTHGIQLLPNLVSRLLDGAIDAKARGQITQEGRTTAVIDGQNGVGQVISRFACSTAARMAKLNGVGFIAIRNSNHFGAGATWVERLAEEGLVGIALCNSFPLMAPWGGRDARLGTNPLAVAVPCGNEGPWVLDMATSAVAMNKLLVVHRNGQRTIPDSWALDRNGTQTTDVKAALDGGTLMPAGGNKGAGIAMLIDILSGVLSGGMFGTDVGAFNAPAKPSKTSAFIGAIDVSAFMPIDEFRSRMDRFVQMMCSSAPAEGFSKVMVPGQPESQTKQRRLGEGIPITESLLQALQSSAAKVSASPLVVG